MHVIKAHGQRQGLRNSQSAISKAAAVDALHSPVHQLQWMRSPVASQAVTGRTNQSKQGASNSPAGTPRGAAARVVQTNQERQTV